MADDQNAVSEGMEDTESKTMPNWKETMENLKQKVTAYEKNKQGTFDEGKKLKADISDVQNEIYPELRKAPEDQVSIMKQTLTECKGLKERIDMRMKGFEEYNPDKSTDALAKRRMQNREKKIKRRQEKRDKAQQDKANHNNVEQVMHKYAEFLRAVSDYKPHHSKKGGSKGPKPANVGNLDSNPLRKPNRIPAYLNQFRL
jgi:hypothetical protein